MLLTTKVEPFTLIISPSLGLRPFTSHLRSGTVNGVLDKAEGIEEDDEEEEDDDEEFDVYAAAADTAVYALADAAAAAAEASSNDDEKCLVVECATGVEISFSFFPLKS